MLKTVITSQAKDSVERMASYYGISQREIIELPIADAEQRVMNDIVLQYHQKQLVRRTTSLE